MAAEAQRQIGKTGDIIIILNALKISRVSAAGLLDNPAVYFI